MPQTPKIRYRGRAGQFWRDAIAAGKESGQPATMLYDTCGLSVEAAADDADPTTATGGSRAGRGVASLACGHFF